MSFSVPPSLYMALLTYDLSYCYGVDSNHITGLEIRRSYMGSTVYYHEEESPSSITLVASIHVAAIDLSHPLMLIYLSAIPHVYIYIH